MQTPGVHLAPAASVLLVATFSPGGAPLFRDSSWRGVFGDEPEAWSRLNTEDGDAARASVNEAADGHLVTHVLVNAPAARGEPFPVLLHFIPVHTNGIAAGRASAITVTGEVLAEPSSFTQAPTRRHRLEALGRMTMGIAHDFNNLLASILGHAELLREHAGFQAAGPEAAEHVTTMERAALDGATLIGKIQRFLRQEKEDRFAPVDLAEIARDAAALTRPYWHNEPRRTGIHIALDADLATVPPIVGSAPELREVLVNLILNAVQAMPDGGTLRLATRYDAAARQAILAVEDTGTGMPPDVQARIFEPMYSTKGEAGNGMGLAVSYGIVQAHDGTITVESAPGRGTRFTLAFPLAARKTFTPTPEAAAAPERRTARLLVVDDEPLVREVLARLLRLRGHEVAQAASAMEALEIAARQPFDAVLTDLGMPGMNGRALALALHERYPGLPVMLLTGDTEAGMPDTTIAAVLTKPFRADDVERALQKVLR